MPKKWFDGISSQLSNRRAMKARPSEYSLLELVRRNSALLDAALGANEYRIDGESDAIVNVEAAGLTLQIFRDRNFLICFQIAIKGEGYEASGIPEIWLRKIDYFEPMRWEKDEHGWITATPEAMLQSGFGEFGRVLKEVFLDENCRRDAANFVDGYHACYTDKAAGHFD